MKKTSILLVCSLVLFFTADAQWSLTGNAISTGNFLGTTNAQPLNFKVNSTWAGTIDPSNQNCGFGLYALQFNTTGTSNVAVGYLSLPQNTTGTTNTAVGIETMYDNISGSDNTAVGSLALYHNTSGNNSDGFGTNALQNNTTGSYNDAYGSRALESNTTGTGNVAIGYQALTANTTGSSNTAVGYEAGLATNGLTNTIALGGEATASVSNQAVIGNSSITSIGGFANWTNFSDGRYKKNVKENVPGLAFIQQLRPITYTLDVTGINKALRPSAANSTQDDAAIQQKEKIVYTGFISQEVQAAAKKMSYDFSGVDAPQSDKGFYGLRYTDFVVPLVKAVQELGNTNDSLKNVITNLQTQFNELQQQINALKGGTASGLSNSGAVLRQNAPNPFNGNTNISYFIPSKAAASQLTISDVNGQVLKTVVISGKGEGLTTIYAGELASGTYFYSLVVDGNKVDTKKMVLTR